MQPSERLAEGNRDTWRWFQREHALELLRAHRLRLPSEERLTRASTDHPQGLVQANDDGEDAIVEYMNDRGLWEFAEFTWETFQAIARAP